MVEGCHVVAGAFLQEVVTEEAEVIVEVEVDVDVVAEEAEEGEGAGVGVSEVVEVSEAVEEVTLSKL